jgi:peptidoglycan/LPS O-acetylase OafA/YrhL
LQGITLNSFRRITTTGAFIPEIDGLRFIAVISVVFLHCYAEVLRRMAMGAIPGQNGSGSATLPMAVDKQQGLLRLLGHGGNGIVVFFSISGFILAWPFARQYLQGGRVVDLRFYFLPRLTRLEPPYIVWLLIRCVLLLASHNSLLAGPLDCQHLYTSTMLPSESQAESRL